MITFLKINSSIRYKKFYPKYLVLYCNFNFLLTLSKQYNTIEGCYVFKAHFYEPWIPYSWSSFTVFRL